MLPKPQETADLVILTEKVVMENLILLCIVFYLDSSLILWSLQGLYERCGISTRKGFIEINIGIIPVEWMCMFKKDIFRSYWIYSMHIVISCTLTEFNVLDITEKWTSLQGRPWWFIFKIMLVLQAAATTCFLRQSVEINFHMKRSKKASTFTEWYYAILSVLPSWHGCSHTSHG